MLILGFAHTHLPELLTPPLTQLQVFGVCHHADGRVSLVEELEAGGTLHRRLHPAQEAGQHCAAGGGGGAAASAAAAAGPAHMSLGEVAKIGLDVARALAFAHSAGVTHNDVKSQNVLFSAGGTAVLADFGLAKRVRSALPNTMAALLGSSSGGGGLLGGGFGLGGEDGGK